MCLFLLWTVGNLTWIGLKGSAIFAFGAVDLSSVIYSYSMKSVRVDKGENVFKSPDQSYLSCVPRLAATLPEKVELYSFFQFRKHRRPAWRTPPPPPRRPTGGRPPPAQTAPNIWPGNRAFSGPASHFSGPAGWYEPGLTRHLIVALSASLCCRWYRAVVPWRHGPLWGVQRVSDVGHMYATACAGPTAPAEDRYRNPPTKDKRNGRSYKIYSNKN